MPVPTATELNAIEDSILDVPGRRAANRARAELFYGQAGFPDSVRARSAAMVMTALFEDMLTACNDGQTSRIPALESQAQTWAANLRRRDKVNKYEERAELANKMKCP